MKCSVCGQGTWEGVSLFRVNDIDKGDHEEYWESIVEVLDSHRAFERLATFGADDFPLPVDQPLTNFETKYLDQGRKRFRASWLRRPTDE